MNGTHKIAVLGKDVYILYVAEMAPDSRFLLLIYTPEQAEKCKVTGCNLHFLRIAHYGKYCAFWGFRERPQDVG